MIIKCKDIFALLSDLHDCNLEKEVEDLMLEHIRECERCLALFNTFEKTLELFDSLEPIILEKEYKQKFHKWLRIEIQQIKISKKKYMRRRHS